MNMGTDAEKGRFLHLPVTEVTHPISSPPPCSRKGLPLPAVRVGSPIALSPLFHTVLLGLVSKPLAEVTLKVL